MANDPVLIAYVVKDRPGQKSRWLRIGVAFPHDKGSGLTVVLNALPLNFDGRIVLDEPKIDPNEFSPRIPPPTAASRWARRRKWRPSRPSRCRSPPRR